MFDAHVGAPDKNVFSKRLLLPVEHPHGVPRTEVVEEKCFPYREVALHPRKVLRRVEHESREAARCQAVSRGAVLPGSPKRVLHALGWLRDEP